MPSDSTDACSEDGVTSLATLHHFIGGLGETECERLRETGELGMLVGALISPSGPVRVFCSCSRSADSMETSPEVDVVSLMDLNLFSGELGEVERARLPVIGGLDMLEVAVVAMRLDSCYRYGGDEDEQGERVE